MEKGKYKTALAGALNQFITTPEQTTTEPKQSKRAAHNAPPVVYKAKTDAENPRTRRVQLLFRADTHAELVEIAHSQGQSLNNLIEEVLNNYLNSAK